MVETNLPIILLKNKILFPYSEVRVEFTRSKDKLVLENSLKYNDNHVLLVNLVDPLEENPNVRDLPNLGVVGKIKSKIELSNGVVRVVLAGLERVEVLNYLENDYGYLESFVVPIRDYDYDDLEANALKRILIKDLNQYIDISSLMSNSVLGRIVGVDNISKFADIVCSELPIDYSSKLKYLMEANPIQRIKMIIEDLSKEIETINLENEIELSLKDKIDASQREYLLREKIRIIKEELGESTIKDMEIESLREKISLKDLPIRVRKRVQEELKRYILSSEASPEVTIIRTYIDWILSLPWRESSSGRYKVKQVQEILNETHYGLDNVKRRIIEFVSVAEKTNSNGSTIICLVGPPGVGKTTLAKSIAKSLNKKFVKISVGGVSDEAEIIGHRRTYLGANPGKIIQGMKKAGVNNPVFLIDEVDKLTKDYHGDPASALLDVLDKEQNRHFCDNYIEEEFDLSKVLFILTANDISKIPVALRDRLEVIELSSYTNYDKKEICKKYLIPKLFKEYKIRDNNVSVNDFAINKIIEDYTKEAGARELSRKIEQICRKIVYEDLHDVVVKASNLKDFLGPVKYYHQKNDTSNQSGIVNALAYTVYGGEILKVSATCYEGNGKIKVTGSVGKVMEESVEVALSYIKANARNFGLEDILFQFRDFHVHIEEGASPKDGPSAGITIVTTILSLLKDEVIANDISMTGEMTLRGKILPIGGLKEKLIAASVNGIQQVFIPLENKVDLEDVPDEIRKKLDIILVRDYLDVYYYLFHEEGLMEEESKQTDGIVNMEN
ncbi:MAG: endopeptidase La [Erysipelotrichaceae bacterium]|nr:endopeptidase La [Erysipelotrichaceae bacterium]